METRKIIKYKLLSATYTKTLNDEIEKLLDMGYQPKGDVIVTSIETGNALHNVYFTIQMVKYEDSK